MAQEAFQKGIQQTWVKPGIVQNFRPEHSTTSRAFRRSVLHLLVWARQLKALRSVRSTKARLQEFGAAAFGAGFPATPSSASDTLPWWLGPNLSTVACRLHRSGILPDESRKVPWPQGSWHIKSLTISPAHTTSSFWKSQALKSSPNSHCLCLGDPLNFRTDFSSDSWTTNKTQSQAFGNIMHDTLKRAGRPLKELAHAAQDRRRQARTTQVRKLNLFCVVSPLGQGCLKHCNLVNWPQSFREAEKRPC